MIGELLALQRDNEKLRQERDDARAALKYFSNHSACKVNYSDWYDKALSAVAEDALKEIGG